jgi:hypothetical protein
MAGIIENWRHAWRYYSVWAMAVLVALPDLYNALLAAGLLEAEAMPPLASWSIRIVAIVGLVVRFIKQKRPEPPAS